MPDRPGPVAAGGSERWRAKCFGYRCAMAQRARDFNDDAAIAVVNPEADTSIEAIAAWITELEADDDWIELTVTAAELIAEDRNARPS
jgi:hypothetical protein